MEKLIFLILVIAIIAAFVISRGKIKTSGKRYEKELLTRCLGDKTKAERLISYELTRNPNLSRENAAKNASESITRDNR